MATKKPAKKTAKRPAKKAAAKKPARKPAAKKKAAPKKPAARKAAPKKPAVKKVSTAVKEEQPIGRVTHYFDHLKVAVIKLEDGQSLKLGDTIRIEGGELNFTQKIESLQVEHEDVEKVGSGDDFGTKVKKLVREGYRVYKA